MMEISKPDNRNPNSLLSDSERIGILVQKPWITYPKARDLLDKLERLIGEPASARPNCMLIVGETNNGKTSIVRRFSGKYKKETSSDNANTTVPVVYAITPQVPDESRLYLEILDRVGAPPLTNVRNDLRYRQVLTILRAVQTKMIIIDEIQNLLIGNSAKQRIFLNTIKNLGNSLEIPIVAVGTKDAYRAIQTDPQLENRFTPEAIPRWTYNVDFLRLLKSFETVLPLRRPTDITQESIARVIFDLSEGYIGEISKVIRLAAEEAIRRGTEELSLELIRSLKLLPPSARSYKSLNVNEL